MRWAVAAVLLVSTLAGCTAGDDPNTPPNADPNRGESYPPLPGSSTPPPTAPPPNATSSSSSSSSSAAPAPRVSAQEQEDSDTDGDFPSLFVGGRLRGSGGEARVEATANNVGERAYRIPDGRCAQPWTESMQGPAGAVQLRKPAPACTGFGLRDLPGHEFVSTALTWNGTLWDAASGAYVPAPAGTYTWTVAFDVYSGGSGAQYEDHATLTLDFQVTVA